MVLSLGSGTLTIGGGIVDVMGYGRGGIPVKSPSAGIDAVGMDHPYQKIGRTAIENAVKTFKKICETEGYPYIGNLNETQWIPTACRYIKTNMHGS